MGQLGRLKVCTGQGRGPHGGPESGWPLRLDLTPSWPRSIQWAGGQQVLEAPSTLEGLDSVSCWNLQRQGGPARPLEPVLPGPCLRITWSTPHARATPLPPPWRGLVLILLSLGKATSCAPAPSSCCNPPPPSPSFHSVPHPPGLSLNPLQGDRHGLCPSREGLHVKGCTGTVGERGSVIGGGNGR